MYHVKEKVVSEVEAKKSKFFCILQSVDDEKKIKDCINIIKKEYPSATHYCYGAIINGNNRSNDDGEPASTAGKPILEMLKNHDLDNVLAVVVRYFGGTLLGTAGLVKAYGSATKQAIQQATLTTPVVVKNYKLSTDYQYTNKIEYLLKSNNAEITYRDYQDEAIYYFLSQVDLSTQISQLTNGSGILEYIGEEIHEL